MSQRLMVYEGFDLPGSGRDIDFHGMVDSVMLAAQEAIMAASVKEINYSITLAQLYLVADPAGLIFGPFFATLPEARKNVINALEALRRAAGVQLADVRTKILAGKLPMENYRKTVQAFMVGIKDQINIAGEYSFFNSLAARWAPFMRQWDDFFAKFPSPKEAGIGILVTAGIAAIVVGWFFVSEITAPLKVARRLARR